MDKKVIENHQRYADRLKSFKDFGYDMDKERVFIIDAARPFGGKILDVGTGKGHCAIAIAKEGRDLVSVDISEEAQNFALLNFKYFGVGEKVELKREDASDMSFKDGSFDTVFSVNTFHHLENPFSVLNEIMRVTAVGGKIILSDFSEKGLAVVAEIHKNEGGTHQTGNIVLNDIAKYLIDKNIAVELKEDDFQQVLIIHKEK